MIGYRFTAEPVNFEGEDGYFVKQYRGELVVTEQFVGADGYEAFCKAIGDRPEIL